MNNIESALIRLQSVVVFIPDREIQTEIQRAIEDLCNELYGKEVIGSDRPRLYQ